MGILLKYFFCFFLNFILKVLTLSSKELEFDKLERQQVLVRWLAAPINPSDINQLQGGLIFLFKEK